nr:hypothetical protein [Tanacetum cinerariifolium]
MMKGSDIGIQEKKAKLFNKWERFTSTNGESIESYYHHFLKLKNDLKQNKHFPKKISSNLKFLNNLQPEWSRHVTIVHQTKDMHTTDYTQLQIAQPGMNMGHDRQIQMVGGNDENQFRQYAGQNVGNLNGGVGHFARNCTVRPRRRDATYLQTQLLITQKVETGIQLQAEEFDLMAAVADLDEIEEVGETYALSKPVTSNSMPLPQESKVVKNDKVIALGMFRINPFKPYREEKYVRNKVRASVRTNPITISEPPVITKKVVNSDSNGISSIGVDNTAKTRRPQPRSNIKNDRIPFASKSSCSKNKEVEVEEHPRNLLLSKNKKHMSSECNNVKLATQNVKSIVVCAMCKQCLISANHDVCLINCVNDMNYHGKKQNANVSINENQKKQKPKVMNPKKVGSNKRLASPKPSKPRSFLRWSPTGRLFDLKGKIITSSESKSQSDCSNGDNACTSYPMEPKIKQFPNSTSFLGSSGLDLTYAPPTIKTQQLTEGELDLLFKAMYDDYIGGQPSAAPRTVLAAQAP